MNPLTSFLATAASLAPSDFSPILAILGVVAAIILIAAIFFDLGRRFQRDYTRSTGSDASSPKVIVNIPHDLAPFPQLTPEGHVIAGERAVLWYSVYVKAMDDDLVSDPCRHADNAVETVFGSPPS